MRRQTPGLLVAAAGAALGWVVHLLLPSVPWLTASLVAGVIVGCLPPARGLLDGSAKPGLTTAAKRLLRVGIVVLGLQLSLGDVAGLGWLSILGIAALVVASFAVVYSVARLLRLPGDEPALLAAGFSICGVSAVGAMAAARGSSEEDQARPTTLVTLFGTLAIVVLPLLAIPLGLRGADDGHWIGASVHDVGQVVATAGSAGPVVLAAAVLVKLTRVLMLAPMVALASARERRRMRADAAGGSGEGVSGAGPVVKLPPIVPVFIVGFLVAVLARTLMQLVDWQPAWLLADANLVQSALLAAALTGIGAGLRLERMLRGGGRAIAAGALGWAAILVLALGVVWLAR